MAKRKKKQNKEPREPLLADLSPHTKQAIGAVLLLVLALFISLSLFESAGMAGNAANVALDALFGKGAYLAPFLCAFYIYALLKPQENESVSTSKVIGIALLFISLFAFLNLYTAGYGGWVGAALEWPLTYLMGELATGFILGALMLIGIFLTFDTGLALSRFFAKKEKEPDADIEQLAIPDDSEEATNEEADDSADDESEDTSSAPPAKKGLSDKLSLGKKKTEEFVVSSFEGTYAPPPLRLLARGKGKAKTGDVKANANVIKQTLKNFGIEVEMDQVEIGPTVTRYALKPAQGVKISRIVGLQRELELNLAAGTIRIEAPIPGKSLVGIEVPNTEKATIGLAALLATPNFTDSAHPLLVALGKDITGQPHFANVARMPHALIAGTTGSGKSALIHDLIVSLLYRNSPEQLRFIMVDPKRVELTLYNGIPHLLTEVITDAKKALLSLKWAVKEMERRYDILQAERVQNIASYHTNVYRPAKEKFVAKGSPEDERADLPESLPYIVIVMDELADLMHSYPRELEAAIVRLAQMSRAVGIHLLIATQRPSVNVITGTIKANIPTRLAMQVASQIDSRTILDQVGAEKLLGQGDMLFLSGELAKPTRLQSAFISEDELKNVIDYLKEQPDLQELDTIDFGGDSKENGEESIFGTDLDDEDKDELYEEAKQAVIEANKASTSYLQRKLRIGYSRAARLVDMLEEQGVISEQDGSKARTILAKKDDGGEADNADHD